jgi:hypothetical protein
MLLAYAANSNRQRDALTSRKLECCLNENNNLKANIFLMLSTLENKRLANFVKA